MTATSPSTQRWSWPWVRQDGHHNDGTTPLPAPPLATSCDSDRDGGGRKQLSKINREESSVRDPASASESALPLDRDLWTRDLCVVGLILGWGASLASISTAIVTMATERATIPPWLAYRAAMVGSTQFVWVEPTSKYLKDQRVYGVSEHTMILIPLLLQIAITTVSACLDLIHSTTLRWALWREGRLRHNTNLRLFTCARGGPNAWPANLVSTIGLVLAYGGSSVMVRPLIVMAAYEYNEDEPDANPLNYNADLGPHRYGMSFNSWGLLGLGVGLLLQSIICTWCLVRDSTDHLVATWNTNPLATARACRALLNRDSDKARVSTPDPANASSVVLLFSNTKQASMLSLAPATRAITNWIWAIFTLHAIFAIVVSIVAITVQHSASLDWLREYPAPVDFASVWKLFGLVYVQYNFQAYRSSFEWAGLLIQCAVLSTLLFGLHLADVLGGLATDEAIWQRASEKHGTSPESNMLLEGIRNWPSCVVFVYKAIVPWVFSYGFACNVNVSMTMFPLLTIAVLFMFLGLFSEFLIRARTKGSQPATFGDLHALIALVDDWSHERLFWGDKGQDEHGEGFRVVGTAGSPLPDVMPGVEYRVIQKESMLDVRGISL